MCWAASASNIIEWWQDRYVAAGNVLPDQAVKGPGQTYELALMEVFHQQWNNNRGGQVAEAVPWYFEGVNYGVTASPGSQAYPLSDSSGGYFKDDWNAIYSHLYHEYTYMLGTYTDLSTDTFDKHDRLTNHWRLYNQLIILTSLRRRGKGIISPKHTIGFDLNGCTL
jgi:hypothetical protein